MTEPMTVDELHEVCAALAWGSKALARACGASESTAARWWNGARVVPGPIADWLRTLASAHRTHPAPVPPPYVPPETVDLSDLL